MANKLLTVAGLKAAVAKTEAAGLVDGPLGKALKLYEFFDEERTNDRRDALDKVIEAIQSIFKAKKSAPTDRAVVKYLNDVLKAANSERKTIEAELSKFGMKKVHVQVLVKDWKDEPMHKRQVFVQFKSPATPEILLKQEIKGGTMEFKDVSLAPVGSVYINAFPSSGASDQAKGHDTYDISKKKSLFQIKAKQVARKTKVKAKSGSEATSKVGVKGKVGFDFVVTAEGEVLYEKDMKHLHESEREYEIFTPEGSIQFEKV